MLQKFFCSHIRTKTIQVSLRFKLINFFTLADSLHLLVHEVDLMPVRIRPPLLLYPPHDEVGVLTESLLQPDAGGRVGGADVLRVELLVALHNVGSNLCG